MRYILAAATAMTMAAPALAQQNAPAPTSAAARTIPEQRPAVIQQDPPYATPSVVNHPTTIGWPEGRMPRAPQGWQVQRFAGGLEYPRQALVLPNGDVLVSEARTKPNLEDNPDHARGKALSRTTGISANRITLLRDANRDGVAEQRFTLLEGLNQPFGMQYANGRLYVGTTNAVLSYAFQPGQTRVAGEPRRHISLPEGGYENHWTRNLLLSADQRTLYVSVGSYSNVGEEGLDVEKRRAAILALDLQSGRERIYASGLRNPVGMAWASNGVLWTAVNERDEIGDDVAPDYLVGVREGGFYGWPYSYWGVQDPRWPSEGRERLATTLMPDVDVGAHSAALGLAFSNDGRHAYVARHGSWNRSSFSGYDVQLVPFEAGRPSGPPQPFLTGFIADERQRQVYGRPTSVQVRPDGALLVMDDAGDTVWLVSQQTQGTGTPARRTRR